MLNISPLPAAWTLEDRMDPCFHLLFTPNSDSQCLNVSAEIETHQIRQHFWSEEAVLQGSMDCSIRAGILCSLAGMTGYLSYCFFSFICPISSDLSHQRDVFVHRTAVHWIFSLFFWGIILCKPQRSAPKAFLLLNQSYWLFKQLQTAKLKWNKYYIYHYYMFLSNGPHKM